MESMKATEMVIAEARIDELELQLAKEKAINAKLAGDVRVLRETILERDGALARCEELAKAGEGALWLYELRDMIDGFVKSKEATAYVNNVLRIREREEKLAAACATEDWQRRLTQGFANADIDTREKVASILRLGIRVED